MSPVTLQQLRPGYRALVIGASGALGRALATLLRQDTRCVAVQTVDRHHPIDWDLCRPDRIAALATQLQGPFHLVLDATGALTLDGHGPEKRLADLQAERLLHSLQVNAVGPLLLLRHLEPLLARGERVVWGKLSARVGSIEDNRKGGWYGYRMAKAALNQGLQTAAIEMARQRPDLVVAALQPGTVQSALSRPFVGDAATRPADAAAALLRALDGLRPTGRAQFIDHAGHSIPW